MEQATYMAEGLVQPNFDDVKGVLYRAMGLKIMDLRESRGDPMQVQGQNIPLVTNSRSGMYLKAFLKFQSCTCLCRSPKSNGASNPHGRRPCTQATVFSINLCDLKISY